MGGGDLFGTNLHAIEDRFAAPHTSLTVDGLQNGSLSLIPGVGEESVGLGKHRRPQKLGIHFKSGAVSKADAAEDAIGIGINLLPLLLRHGRFAIGRNGLGMKVGINLSIVIEEDLHIDNEIPDDREKGKRFNEDRFSQQIFHRGSAGQHHPAIDPHGARAADGTPAGVAEGKGTILLILYL